MSERFSRRRPLGRGGSGVVFEAIDTETGALVAPGISLVAGDDAQDVLDDALARRKLETATEDFVRADMRAHAAGARWSMARMRGDEAAIASEEDAMRGAGIARPARFVAVMIGAHDLAESP